MNRARCAVRQFERSSGAAPVVLAGIAPLARRWISAGLAAGLLVACTRWRSSPALESSVPAVFTASAWPEADQLFHRDPHWLGADAAFSVDLGGGRVLWLFGDTFIATSEMHSRRESKMVRNTIAVQRGLDPSCAAIEFSWKPGPSSWLADGTEEWSWPQHGVRIPGGPLILFFSRVRATAGEGLGFRAVGWKAVIVDDPEDSPDRWRPRELDAPPFPSGILPAQGLFIEGDFVYGLAIREPGDHAGFALRIPVAALERGDLGALALWDGAWSQANVDSKPSAVIADAAPESSLHFDRASKRYLHVRSLGFGDTTLAVASAERITGPWSNPESVYHPPESQVKGAFVYAGKAHPELLGADLVATYACNSFDFATLVADTNLYFPRFVRWTGNGSMETSRELGVDRAALYLGRGGSMVLALFDHVPVDLVRWKPSPERWSLLEVVNHLADEEVLDFRARIVSTLRDPKAIWPAIKPQDWVLEKKYNERDPVESLDRFLAERKHSLEWLRTVRDAAWSNVYMHPKVGPLSAKMLLANWVAHDLLHARQMLRLHHEHVSRLAAPETLDYAGPW